MERPPSYPRGNEAITFWNETSDDVFDRETAFHLNLKSKNQLMCIPGVRSGIQLNINSFMPNEILYLTSLDRSISYIRDAG